MHAESPIEIPLKAKYLNVSTPKFGGKKRSAGNSGKVGKAWRRHQRGLRLSVDHRPQRKS